MVELSLEQIQRQYEGQHFDRKSARLEPKSLRRHVIALANAEGGVLVIGVEDDGSITGTNYEGAYSLADYKRAVEEELADKVDVTYSRIYCKNQDGEDDSIYVVEVSVCKGKLVRSINGSVYLRISHQSRKQNQEQIAKLEQDISKRCYEDLVIGEASLNNIDCDSLEYFKKRLDLTDLSDSEFLNYFKFLKNNKLTLAGLLLFGKDLEEVISNNKLEFEHFEGDKLVSRKILTGSVPKILDKIHSIIRPLMGNGMRKKENGYVELVPDFPEFAWSEGIVNALLHRDYSIKDDWVKVKLYDDCIEVYSPGELLAYVDIENIGQVRYARNPRLARWLSVFGWGKRNEGIDKINAVMAKSNLNKPHYELVGEKGLLLRLENNRK